MLGGESKLSPKAVSLMTKHLPEGDFGGIHWVFSWDWLMSELSRGRSEEKFVGEFGMVNARLGGGVVGCDQWGVCVQADLQGGLVEFTFSVISFGGGGGAAI